MPSRMFRGAWRNQRKEKETGLVVEKNPFYGPAVLIVGFLLTVLLINFVVNPTVEFCTTETTETNGTTGTVETE